MRVISGTARGRRLAAPAGLDTRPTAEHIKEALFNIVQFDIEGRPALDLFAGSGQLGIEALSRGAKRCTFVDNRQDALKVIRKNIETTGFLDVSRVVPADFEAFLRSCGKNSFGLIMMDPPYGGELLRRAVSLVCEFDILAVNGIMICESAASDELSEPAAPYSIKKTYRYGAKKLTLITRDSE